MSFKNNNDEPPLLLRQIYAALTRAEWLYPVGPRRPGDEGYGTDEPYLSHTLTYGAGYWWLAHEDNGRLHRIYTGPSGLGQVCFCGATTHERPWLLTTAELVRLNKSTGVRPRALRPGGGTRSLSEIDL